MIHAIPFEIYQSKYDCTNGGISSKYKEGYVVLQDGNIEFDEEHLPENLFYIESRVLFGQWYYNLKPYVSLSDGKGYMFGGNIGFTSDSRVGGNPLKIHDRTE